MSRNLEIYPLSYAEKQILLVVHRFSELVRLGAIELSSEEDANLMGVTMTEEATSLVSDGLFDGVSVSKEEVLDVLRATMSSIDDKVLDLDKVSSIISDEDEFIIVMASAQKRCKNENI